MLRAGYRSLHEWMHRPANRAANRAPSATVIGPDASVLLRLTPDSGSAVYLRHTTDHFQPQLHGDNMQVFYTVARRTVLLGAVLAAASHGLAFGQGGAAAFPERPVKIVVPLCPGAGTDAMGRLLAQKLGEAMGAGFVVENRTGASRCYWHAVRGAAACRRLHPVAGGVALHHGGCVPAHRRATTRSRALRRWAWWRSGPLVWAANKDVPANTMQELVALARQKPGALDYGLGGCGWRQPPGAGAAQGKNRHLHHPHSVPWRGTCRGGQWWPGRCSWSQAPFRHCCR